MGFLHRSKSARILDRQSHKKTSKHPLPGQVRVDSSTIGKRSASLERPKTAGTTTSFRPRTANAAVSQTSAWAPPSFNINVKAGDEVFSFPMPSPLTTVFADTTAKKRPSALQILGSPSIGVAIGSPTQAPPHVRPTLGRSITAGSTSYRRPVQPPPSRPPPAVPSHVDLETLSCGRLKKRKSAWKTLGRVVSQRQTMILFEEPTYKLKMPNAIQERDILIPDLAELPEYGSTPTFGPRTSSLMPPHPAPIAHFEQGQAAPLPDRLAETTQFPFSAQQTTFSPLYRTFNEVPEDEVLVDDLRNDSPMSGTSPNLFTLRSKPDASLCGPHLETLNLPDPKFERYSVMFRKAILEASAPSLFERRQSKFPRTQNVQKLELFPSINNEQSIPHLQINGIPQRTSTTPPTNFAQPLSLKTGRKVLSPVAEIFTTKPLLRRSKPTPSLTLSSLSPRSPNFQHQCTSPASMCETDSSLPLTPMTFTTISDCGSTDILETDTEDVTSQPQLNINISPAKRRKRKFHLSIARQVSVSNAIHKEMMVDEDADTKSVGSSTIKPPLRARMVELCKNRASAGVVIAISQA